MRLWIRWALFFYFFLGSAAPLLLDPQKKKKRGSCVALVGAWLIWNRPPPSVSPQHPRCQTRCGWAASQNRAPLTLKADSTHAATRPSLQHPHPPTPLLLSPSSSSPPVYRLLIHSSGQCHIKTGGIEPREGSWILQRLVESRLWCPPAPSSGSSLFLETKECLCGMKRDAIKSAIILIIINTFWLSPPPFSWLL